LAAWSAGISTAINIAMIAITTNSSIRVNPLILFIARLLSCESVSLEAPAPVATFVFRLTARARIRKQHNQAV
jgi:hypothetical protein